MAAADTGIWLGPAGGMVPLPRPAADAEASRERLGALHALAGGGAVMQTSGYRRGYRLQGTWLDADQFAVWDLLASMPGPYRLVDTAGRRNHLTVNQSTCSDLTADRTGMVARFQGTLASDATVFRSGGRSVRWDTATALASTNRGIYWYQSPTTVDHTWTAVLPTEQYTFAVYARTSAAVNAYAAIDWYTSAGGSPISTSFGTSTPLPTANWLTRLFITAISPPTAAYATGALLNADTTGGAISVYADDAMLSLGSLQDWMLGTGTPVVAVDQLSVSYPLAGFYDTELSLVELSP